MNERCTIKKVHCENCGSVNPEDIDDLRDTDGYTRCCNELLASADYCRNHHG